MSFSRGNSVRRITIRDLALRVSEIYPDSVHRIVTEQLDYNKMCVRWRPLMPTADHKLQCVDCHREFLQECTNNTEEFFDFIALEAKERSRQSLHITFPKAKKLKHTQSAGKV